MKKITIDPLTRLEGHRKIEIFLNGKGDVVNANLQIPELRGFGNSCKGRRAEDMPIITPRIYGVCPVAHHFASTKALDAAYNVEPTETAKKLRELMTCGYYIYDHTLHFPFLGSPGFIMGPDTPPAERNIFGALNKEGLDLGRNVIKHRTYGQKITQIIGGKVTHPSCGIPGGVSKELSDEERDSIESMSRSSLRFAQDSLKIFETHVLKNKEYVDLIQSDHFQLDTYNMGLVDDDNYVNLYDGKVRVTDPFGVEYIKFNGSEYLDYISEYVEPRTNSKFTYLKKVGWQGLTDGYDSGIYRVGPLGRLNASKGMATPLANKEYKTFYSAFGGRPVMSTLAYHWARFIELLYAAERALELSRDPRITGMDLRNPVGEPGEGVGVVEAARGTLFHHYKLNEKGLVDKVNLIVATTQNYANICMSVRDATKGFIYGSEASEGLLNRIEMVFRAYDPCFSCSTHFLPGTMPLQVDIYDQDRNLFKTVKRG